MRHFYPYIDTGVMAAFTLLSNLLDPHSPVLDFAFLSLERFCSVIGKRAACEPFRPSIRIEGGKEAVSLEEQNGRFRMRRMMLALIVVALLVVSFAPAAFGHVHGVTPLLQCSVDNANSGGNRTDDTPAANANGGPIVGLIPRDTGNAPLTGGDGGFGAPVQCP